MYLNEIRKVASRISEQQVYLRAYLFTKEDNERLDSLVAFSENAAEGSHIGIFSQYSIGLIIINLTHLI